MKTALFTLFLIGTANLTFAQRAEDEIRAARLKEGSIYFNHALDFKTNPFDVGYGDLKDSSLFAIWKDNNTYNYFVFIEAYNPLHYSLNVSEKVLQNQVDMAVIDMLDKIDFDKSSLNKDSLSDLESGLQVLLSEETISQDDYAELKKIAVKVLNNKDISIVEINKALDSYPIEVLKLFTILKDQQEQQNGFILQQTLLEEVTTGLKKSGTKQITEALEELIALKFNSKSETLKALDQIKKELKTIEAEYKTILANLNSFDVSFSKALENKMLSGELKLEYLLLKSQSRDLRDVYREQLNLLKNLRSAYDKVMAVIESQESAAEANGQWFFSASKGKIEESKGQMIVLNLSLVSHPKKLENGILVDEKDSKTKQITFNLIKYRIFVPEISAGIVWTKQDFRDFTTTTDASGVRTVGQETESPMYERIAVTSMINWNLNFSRSPLLPFVQTGLGLTGKVPLAFIGTGLRIDFGNQRTFAVSMGASFTGIKELSTLNLGDAVNDQLEIDNDMEYRFSGPKFYFGIQYDF